MSDRFTDSVEPFALATQGRTIEGEIPLADLTRLSTLARSSQSQNGASKDTVASDSIEGSVEFTLCFDIDEGGAPRIGGNVSTTFRLQCQRCMEEMDYPVTLKVRLGIVPSREAAANLPDSYDPLVVSGDEITITSILEDELILALPIVAMHEVESCSEGKASRNGSDNYGQQAGQENPPSSKRENPFAVLAQLKKNQP
jgi:uncharacterized protein